MSHEVTMTQPTTTRTAELTDLARRIRLDTLAQIKAAGSGHPGGSLSCADMLAVLYGYAIDVEQYRARAQVRDHVILSKGHAAPALYAALANVGLIPRDELSTLRQLGSRLQGHPDRSRLPLVEMSTGSLGQGLSVALGIAWWLDRQSEPANSFVVLGDGELDSGNIWEAVGFAGAKGARRLVALIDANGVQNDGHVKDILDLRPYASKLRAFGWLVREVDGNDVASLVEAIDWARAEPGSAPRAIVGATIKGKGVSYMEGRPEWHSHALTDEQYQQAVAELAEVTQ
jgi:transketolase